jgi:hypothetical protein
MKTAAASRSDMAKIVRERFNNRHGRHVLVRSDDFRIVLIHVEARRKAHFLDNSPCGAERECAAQRFEIGEAL